MDFLPVFLNLNNQSTLVVGGGPVGLRKARQLLDAGASVTLVAPRLNDAFQALTERPDFTHLSRGYSDEDLAGKHLVVAATDDPAVNARIGEQCRAQAIPVNVVDNPSLCSFIFPSVLDRSPVMVAVSTAGASPVLARQLRTRLETLIPSAYGRLARLLEANREKVRSVIPDERTRKRFWEALLQGPMSEMVFAGQDERAQRYIEEALKKAPGEEETGEVYLVGAGPGDPDLLTFRAVRLMQQADVVVYDRLVSKPILDMTRRDAERFYVGKEKDHHAVPQDGINQLLVDLARQGKRVLRLKGGDPFIFGRGGEEIETLAQEGINFQVVPGITAAAGCASYSGIPLTHRDYAQSCTFVTGHLKDGSLDLNWDALAHERQTLVFYMGLTGIAVISRELIAHGMAADTPAALIEQGTTPNQRVLIGTLANLPDIVVESQVRAPTLTIVGDVVRLHDKLEWYQPEAHRQGTVFSRNEPKS